MIGAPLQDVEVVTLRRTLDRGAWQPHEVASIRRAIADRQQQLIAGLADPTAQIWTRKLQAEVENRLRMRNDPKQGFVIDRWTGELWEQIPGVIGKQHIRPGLCDRMKGQYDMQRVSSPKQDADAASGKIRHPYLQQKDAKSRRKRDENDHKATEKVLNAVDSLSEKRVKEFVQVERAMQTGETVIMHGPTEKMYDRMKRASESVPAAPDDSSPSCSLPGTNPFVRKRKTGGKHIRE